MPRSAHKSWMGRLTGPARKAAAERAPRDAAPSGVAVQGLGLTSERSRERMVERLAESGITHPGVLAAMAATPRHRFVDEGLASRAYEDTALPIGHGQTISQPYVVARMTEVLCALPRLERVLEIGTGCGYQAAILAAVAGEVYSVERLRVLHERARLNLRPLRLPNLRLVHGDGLAGLPEAAPFDGILIAAAAAALPEGLLAQLRVGGAAVAPLGASHQTLLRIVRTGPSRFDTEELGPVRFVPLLPGVA